ncbi:MAG: protein translocase subunit SecF [Spirochaetaceae bacterium]|nr:protein translocase subunit SecF [Spirochaetaceae bacterium]GMO21151.1 MAG: protein translocase subunit SecF [Termitinemataceae bacterium]
MKRIIRFSKIFIPAALFSLILIAAGITGYIYNGGFNLGVDFQAGLLQELQFAPKAFSITYSGSGNASVQYDKQAISIVITGSGSPNEVFNFNFDSFKTLGALTEAMQTQVSGLAAELSASKEIKTEWLVESAEGTPQLSASPYSFHYLEPGSSAIEISEVRDALTVVYGSAVAVQELGEKSERRFMIRLQDDEKNNETNKMPLKAALEAKFGKDSVAITSSDYVGSRFSRQLQEQAWILMTLTMILILVYASIRFKPQFAIGAVLAIAHDAFVMVAFIVWTRMEFNTTTIAAILTILGYSINDTIVVFDRIRETRKFNPDDDFRNVLDRALSETLARTIITTFTTMLAVFSLYIFTSGSMKDFALALIVGMLSGVYSTIFVASGWTLFWERHIKSKNKKALPVQTAS